MNHKFSKNNKYYTIALYTIAVVTICSLIIRVIMNWESTSSTISHALKVLYPFLFGLLIAYFLNPLSKILDHFLNRFFKDRHPGIRKGLSILLSYIIVLGLIITVLFYIIPQIIDSLTQITSFINSAQSGYNQFMDKVLELESTHPEWDLSGINDAMEEIPDKIINIITKAIPTIIPTIYNTSMSLISGFLNVIIAIIVSVYMLIDKNRLIFNAKRVIYAIFGQKTGDKLLHTGSECNRIFSSFIIGKLIDSLIIGILCFIAMSILKLPYALIISVIVGVTNMIPYFGPFIGAVPGILLLLFVSFKYALIFTVLIIVLQQFDGLYLGPKILGESTGLRPLWIIFAITVGGSIAGVLGMFLGVPTLAVIAYILNYFIEKRLHKYGIFFLQKEEPEEPAGEKPTATAEENIPVEEENSTDTEKEQG
ncbi:membrane protein Lmo0908 [Roseburia sp. CAG:303]|nr:membrane protein Lmo0908 [Roseburia sp. CAG:303]